MNKEEWNTLIEKYLKGTINSKEKDKLLDESLKCLNNIAILSRAITRTSREME